MRGSSSRRNLLLLARNRLGRTLACACIGMGTLPADGQTAAMPQPTVAAKIHQPLDVHGNLAPQVTLNNVVTVDDFANLKHFLVGQLGHSPLLRNPDFPHDFIGFFWPDPMDILQCDNNAFVGRYIDAGDAGHVPSLLLPAQSKWPALVPQGPIASNNTTPFPVPRGPVSIDTRLGWGLLMDSTAFRQPPLAFAFAAGDLGGGTGPSAGLRDFSLCFRELAGRPFAHRLFHG